MRINQLSDAEGTVRFAPYTLAVALITLAVSLFWVRPPLAYLPVAVLSGASVFLFHFLRWRSGRAMFQLAAMVVAFVPLFFVMSRLPRGVEMVQYLATFILSYTVAVVVFRRQILKGLNQAA